MLTFHGDGHVQGLQLDNTSQVSVTPPLSGAQTRELINKLTDEISLFDFMTPTQIAAVRAGTLGADVTAAVQAAVSFCQSNTQGAVKTLYAPAGKYKLTSRINFTTEFIVIRGDGPFATQFIHDGVVAGGFGISGGGLYLRAIIKDLAILGDASSGPALDLSGVGTGGQVYMSEFRNLYLRSGATPFYAPGSSTLSEFFNNRVISVYAHSYNSHAFHVANGPGTTYQDCYAIEVPAGKAGYRMAGVVNLIGCNGLNEGDVWGAFGSKIDGTDGFQSDFGFTDYPLVMLDGCNLERFGSLTINGMALRLCNSTRYCEINGGSIQRADTDIPSGVGSYKAIISAYGAPNQTGSAIKFNPGALYLRDVVNSTGPNTPSLAHFYFEFGGHLEDTKMVAETANITSYRVNADSLSYPTARSKLINDIYGGFAQEHRALSPRRLSVQHLRYNTGAPLTPVGANQAINVTGRSKVVVTPASAASISTATFTATPGDNNTDYGRNGDLIIEAGNANLTIKHSAGGANTFYLSGGADLTLAAGQIVRFTRSETGSNWWQVGGASGGVSSTGQTMVSIFHNPLLDIWGANDPTVGPPSGVTAPGSAVKETTIYWPGNQNLSSVKLVSSGTTIGNGCTIQSTNQPWGGPPGPASVSITIPIYSLSATRFWVVHGYDGTTYTLLGQTAAVANAWTLIKGTFTPAPGSTWQVIVSCWDGTTYYSGFQCYLGGINMVRGTTPADTIEDSISRRNFIVITNTAPSFRPDFTGERWWDSSTGKWWMANGQTSVGNWVALN